MLHDILASVREMAQQEGRQLQALIEEALSDLIEKILQHVGLGGIGEPMARAGPAQLLN